MREIDERIVTVTVEVRNQLRTYTGLNISAQGVKYTNENQAEAQIKISNLAQDVIDYIVSETSPFNKNRIRKRIIIGAGRKSRGVSTVYTGEVTEARVSQPPDVTIELKCLAADFQKGNIVARAQNSNAQLSTISQQVANDLGVGLNFQAQDFLVSNYSFTGAAIKQVTALNQIGRVNAYIDNDLLVVKNFNAPLKNSITVISAETGMIGIPEFTEEGLKVKFLLDSYATAGGLLRVDSKVYKPANGDYVIYKLEFEIESRDTAFYWIAHCKRI